MTHISPGYISILIMFIYYFVASFYVPAMPTIALELNTTPEAVKSSMTYFQLGAVLMCFFAGLFADSIGRKTLIKVSLLIAILGCVLAVLATDIQMLIYGRFLQGIGAITTLAMSFVITINYYDKTEAAKFFALGATVNPVIWALMPTVSGFLTDLYGWRSVFVVLTIFLTAAYVFFSKFIPDDFNRSGLTVGQQLKGFLTLMGDRTFMSYGLMLPAVQGMHWCIMTLLPFYYFQTYNIDLKAFGVHATVIIFGLPCGGYLSQQIMKVKSLEYTILLSILISSVPVIVFYLGHVYEPVPVYIITFSAFLHTLCMGLIYAGSASLAMSSQKALVTQAGFLRTIFATLMFFAGAFLAQNINTDPLFYLALLLGGSFTILLFMYALARRTE